MLRTVVLHRVVGYEGGVLVTNGDRNSWLDPDRLTHEAVAGRLRVRVPEAGLLIGVLRRPWGALAAGPALMAVTGTTTRARTTAARRRRKAPAVHRPPLRRLDSPLVTGAAGLLIAAVALGVPAFTHGGEPVAAYRQQVDLRYAADADPAVYDRGRLRTGDPVYPRLTRRLPVQLGYRLLAADLSEASGRIGLVARLSAANGWQRTVPLAQPRAFHGPAARLEATVDLRELQDLVRSAQQRTGTVDGGYRLALVAQVQVDATIGGRGVEARYAPAVSFQLLPDQLVLEGGGTHERGTPLTRTALVPGDGRAQLEIAGRELPVRTARGIALALVLGALLLTLAALSRSARRVPAVLDRQGRAAVDVDAAELDRPAVDVHDLDALLDIAERYDRPLLRARTMDGDTGDSAGYLVEDRGTVYRYLPPEMRRRAPAAQSAAEPDAAPAEQPAATGTPERVAEPAADPGAGKPGDAHSEAVPARQINVLPTAAPDRSPQADLLGTSLPGASLPGAPPGPTGEPDVQRPERARHRGPVDLTAVGAVPQQRRHRGAHAATGAGGAASVAPGAGAPSAGQEGTGDRGTGAGTGVGTGAGTSATDGGNAGVDQLRTWLDA